MPKDTLARGARQASFGSMCHISQAKWDTMFETETPTTDPVPVQEQSEPTNTSKEE